MFSLDILITVQLPGIDTGRWYTIRPWILWKDTFEDCPRCCLLRSQTISRGLVYNHLDKRNKVGKLHILPEIHERNIPEGKELCCKTGQEKIEKASALHCRTSDFLLSFVRSSGLTLSRLGRVWEFCGRLSCHVVYGMWDLRRLYALEGQALWHFAIGGICGMWRAGIWRRTFYSSFC